jgi:hypothetical protein
VWLQARFELGSIVREPEFESEAEIGAIRNDARETAKTAGSRIGVGDAVGVTVRIGD